MAASHCLYRKRHSMTSDLVILYLTPHGDIGDVELFFSFVLHAHSWKEGG